MNVSSRRRKNQRDDRSPSLFFSSSLPVRRRHFAPSSTTKGPRTRSISRESERDGLWNKADFALLNDLTTRNILPGVAGAYASSQPEIRGKLQRKFHASLPRLLCSSLRCHMDDSIKILGTTLNLSRMLRRALIFDLSSSLMVCLWVRCKAG